MTYTDTTTTIKEQQHLQNLLALHEFYSRIGNQTQQGGQMNNAIWSTLALTRAQRSATVGSTVISQTVQAPLPVAIPQKPEKSVLKKLEHKPIKEDLAALDSLAGKAQRLLGYGQLQRKVDEDKLDAVLAELDIAPFDRETVGEYKRKMRVALQAENPNREIYWNEWAIDRYERSIPQNVIDMAVRIKEKLPEVFFRVDQLDSKKPDPFLIVHVGTEDSKRWIAVWDEPTFDIVDAQLKG